MTLSDGFIDWSSEITYLGVFVHSGKSTKFDISHVKRTFFNACDGVSSIEIVHLTLHES
jgi:hypothetical protein